MQSVQRPDLTASRSVLDAILADSLLERNGTLFQVLTAVLVAIGAGIGGWWLRSRNKQTMTLDYQVIDDLPVFSGHERPKDLTVTYRDAEKVTDPRVTRVRFENTGKRPIEENDVWEPYFIERGSVRILDMELLEQSAKSKRAEAVAMVELVADDSAKPTQFTSVKVIPKKMTSGSWFTIQLVYDGGGEIPIEVWGQLKDETRKIKAIDSVEQRNRKLMIYGTYIGVGLAAIGGILKLTGKVQSNMELLGNISLTVGVLTLLFVAMKWSDSKKKDEKKG